MAFEFPPNAICLSCGYALRDLPAPRCPECGREFDPQNWRTFGPRRGWAERMPAYPSGWTCLFAVGVTTLAIADFSAPGINGMMFAFWYFIILLSCILLLVFSLQVTAALVRARHASSEWDRVRKYKWRWLAIPLCTLIISSMFTYNWPLEIGFRLSRRALERAAADYRAGKLDGKDWHWIGLYFIDEIYEPRTGGAPGGLLFVTGYDVIDPVGFHYGHRATAPFKTVQTFTPMWRIAIDD